MNMNVYILLPRQFCDSNEHRPVAVYRIYVQFALRLWIIVQNGNAATGLACTIVTQIHLYMLFRERLPGP